MHAFVSRSQGSGTGRKKSLKKMERLDMQLKGLNADVILCSLFGLTVMKGVVSVVVCVQV